jgi:hypothetical protein
MDEVNFKDIRVLPGSLDLKGNSGKSLSDLVSQLQSGSILKGLIVGNTPKGEVIFHSSLGRFAVPNELGLQRGDTITIRFAGEGEQISGTIMTVNNVASNSSEPVTVAFVRNSGESRVASDKPATPSNVIFDNTSKLPEQIKGNITYLNLSNINKSSLLYKTLELPAQNSKDLPITLKTGAPNQVLRSPLAMQGEVSGNGKDGSQLIKTNFGIITTVGTKMPIGQKLTLEITSVNNRDTNVNIKKEVTDFMFSLNKNWALVKNLSLASFGASGKEIQISGALRSEISQPAGPVGEDTEVFNLQKLGAPISSPKPDAGREQQPAPLSLNQTSSAKIPQGASTLPLNQENRVQRDSVTDTNTVLKSTPQTAQLASAAMTEVMNKAPQILGGLNIRKDGQVEKDEIAAKQEIRQKTLEKTATEMREGRDTTNEQRDINKFLKAFSNQEAIKKLSSEYRVIKELFVTNPKGEVDPNSWQSVMIPFYNGQRIEEQEVKFSRPREHFMRFLIDVNLEELGEIRVDGLVKFQNDNKSPVSFDLIMRSKSPLDSALENKITDIFNLSKQMRGLKGTLSFDKGADF